MLGGAVCRVGESKCSGHSGSVTEEYLTQVERDQFSWVLHDPCVGRDGDLKGYRSSPILGSGQILFGRGVSQSCFNWWSAESSPRAAWRSATRSPNSSGMSGVWRPQKFSRPSRASIWLSSTHTRACTAGRSRNAAIFPGQPASVHEMVLTLERARFIRRQPGAARAIEMRIDPEHLPVLR
jgi:hypothetical protein